MAARDETYRRLADFICEVGDRSAEEIAEVLAAEGASVGPEGPTERSS